MTLYSTAVTAALLPFLGTALGALAVFFLKGAPSRRLNVMLTGFAAGIMMAASLFSLLLPALEQSEGTASGWMAPLLGLAAGFLSMALSAQGLSRLEGARSRSRTGLLCLAVTIHNLPEGMAVGVALGALLSGKDLMSGTAALALSAGIAIQNLPEGAIISMPLAADGLPRRRAFIRGVLSGAVEPLGTLLTLWLLACVEPLLPGILAFAAGAMIDVAVRELIPEACAEAHAARGALAFSAGFLLMTLLDTAL